MADSYDPTTSRPDQSPDDELATARERKSQRPRRYRVLLHNDDFSTMEFVTDMLIRHFAKSHAEATQITLHVHHRGFGVAGVYPKDVAETKVVEATLDARAAGMPLLLTAEPAPEEDGAT